jgi:hypothetical protein
MGSLYTKSDSNANKSLAKNEDPTLSLTTVRGIIVKIHQGIMESLVKSLASELQRGDLTRLSLMTFEIIPIDALHICDNSSVFLFDQVINSMTVGLI